MIGFCSKCGSETNTPGKQFAEKRYGPGKRVHNRCKPAQKERWYRCTDCGNERVAQAGDNE